MKKILALDDDPKVVNFMKMVLDSKGYQTFTATNPADFFKLHQAHQIDLVLLDVRMPIKDGFEVYKEMCLENHPPVLFVTGDSSSFSVESKAAMDLWQSEFLEGKTDILYKPFSIAILYEKVMALIGEAEE